MVLNETINQTIPVVSKITYDQIASIMQTTQMEIAGGALLFLTILTYILWALGTSPRTASGKKLEGNVLSNINGWIPLFIILFIVGGLLLLLFYFPVWLLI